MLFAKQRFCLNLCVCVSHTLLKTIGPWVCVLLGVICAKPCLTELYLAGILILFATLPLSVCELHAVL